MRIVVVGGSGRIGSRLVERLRQRGHQVVVASRSSGIDAVTGEGLEESMEDAEVVVDVSNPPAPDNPQDFFLASGRNLLAAEIAAGVTHHIVLSVVGTDRLPDGGYFGAKVLQEDIVRQSGIPYTIVRATQFFEFLLPIADFSTENRIVRLSTALVQPVAADDVADALAVTALGPPANGTIELAGPESFRLSEAVRRILAAKHDQRTVHGDPGAPYFGVHLDERALMPDGDPRIGPTNLDRWLSRAREPA